MGDRHFRAGRSWVTVTCRDKFGTETEVLREERHFMGEGPAVVKPLVGATINIGNFSSWRIDAGMEMPASADSGIRKQDWERAWAEVQEQFTVAAHRALTGQIPLHPAPPPPPPPPPTATSGGR